MPFICIGPVCIPWTAVVPLVIWLCRPIWVRLPPAYQQAFLTRYGAFQATMQAHVWDRIGWYAKKKQKAAEAEGTAADDAAAAADPKAAQEQLLAGRGGVVGLHSDADWEAALAATRATPGLALVVDFTAVWCGPCQRVAPDFARLAAAHDQALFVKVDVDELEDVSQGAGVSVMPTFQVYKDGALAESMSGANPQKLEAFVAKHAAAKI